MPNSPAIDGTISVNSPVSNSRNTANVVMAAKPGLHPPRRRAFEIGISSLVRNVAIASGTTTGASRWISHKPLRATMPMTMRRQL